MQIHHAITKEKLVTCFEVIKAPAASFRKAFWQPLIRCTTLYDGLIIDFEDFVTRENARGKGYAGHLFNHLVNMAKERSIKTIHLNAANLRFDAHRFYMNKKMKIIAHHFKIKL